LRASLGISASKDVNRQLNSCLWTQLASRRSDERMAAGAVKISAVHAIRTLRYTLTRADAIAYESSRPLLSWRKWAFLLWLSSAGMVLAALPEDWIVGWRFWVLGALLVGVNYLVAMMVMTLDSYRRAARRVPQPVAVEMEEWDNHLVVRSDGSIRRLAYENIAAAVLTTGHLFIHAPPDVVIVPNGAFAQPGDPNDLAEKIMAFGREE